MAVAAEVLRAFNRSPQSDQQMRCGSAQVIVCTNGWSAQLLAEHLPVTWLFGAVHVSTVDSVKA